MEEFKNIKKILKENLTLRRYEHTLGVEETAEKLAKIYGEDVEKAKIAALLHDCAKQFKMDIMKEYCSDSKELIDEYGNSNEILHGIAGSNYAKEKLGIKDEDILNAIRYHTIGRKDMSLLEKIVYIADKIESNRKYQDVDQLRELAYKDIDESIIKEIDLKICYLIKKEVIIHPNTVVMRNWLLQCKKEK